MNHENILVSIFLLLSHKMFPPNLFDHGRKANFASFFRTGAERIVFRLRNFDGFVKSLSAALRCNFVVAAPKGPHSSVFARLAFRGERLSPKKGRPAGRPYKQSHRFGDFLRIHQFWLLSAFRCPTDIFGPKPRVKIHILRNKG
jgi:hypothetical protein